MTNESSNNTFSFRSKFEKLLNDKNREIITKAFEKVCQMAPFDAMSFLWKLTYDPDEVKQLFELAEGDEAVFSAEKVPALRNELRFQYEQRNPDWLAVVIPDKLRDVYATLVNHTDALVANVVYDHCQYTFNVSDETFVNRIHYLLSNDNERLYFGGLRSLRFNPKEASYLKSYHTQISDLFKALLECKADSSKNLPFTGLDKLIGQNIEEVQKNEPNNVSDDVKKDEPSSVSDDVKKSELPEEEKTETPSPESEEEELLKELFEESHNKKKASSFTALTPEMILQNKEVFTDFWKSHDLNLLCEIGKLGFNLNEVMTKSEKIFELLKAANNLSK